MIITEKLIEFMNLETVTVDDVSVLTEAFGVFAENKIDFVDALLYAHNKVRGDRIITFDQKLIKLMRVN
jgi:predicted nucleic acid-binding protein